MSVKAASLPKRPLASAPCPLPRVAHVAPSAVGTMLVVVTEAFSRPGRGALAELGPDGRVRATVASARLRLDAVRYHLPRVTTHEAPAGRP